MVPYAVQEYDEATGDFYKICPECGVHIVVRERKDFESFTGREYAEHYEATHGRWEL